MKKDTERKRITRKRCVGLKKGQGSITVMHIMPWGICMHTGKI